MTPEARAEYIVSCISEAGSMYPQDAAAFLAEHDAHRRGVALTEAAAKLGRIAETVEARVAAHYGAASGIGPGSADMLREAGRTVLDMAGKDTGGAPAGESTQPAPDFFQPGRTYTRGRWSFHCLAVAARPSDGEVRAVGYLTRTDGTCTTESMSQHTWDNDGWTEGGEAR